MKWFGPSWDAPVNRNCDETPTPHGKCVRCGLTFRDGDHGLVLPFSGGKDDPDEVGYHHGCFLVSIGINIPETVEVGQFWVHRRDGLPPVIHEVTMVEGEYAESTSTLSDGTTNEHCILSGVGSNGVGLRRMLDGRDETGIWTFLPDPPVRGSLPDAGIRED
jgi:hypothetical protein